MPSRLTQWQPAKAECVRPAQCAAQELVLHKQSNITIRRRHMESLRGLNWLNDEVVNVYVNLLQVQISLCNATVAC